MLYNTDYWTLVEMPNIASGFDAKSLATTQPTAQCHLVPSISSHLMKAPSHRQTGVAL